MELIVDPWYRILVRDTLNAYYVYQVMGLTVWYISGYYKYASLIVILMIYSIYTEYYDLKESMEKLKLIARYECIVEDRRYDDQGRVEIRKIKSSELVPGDVFKIPSG